MPVNEWDLPTQAFVGTGSLTLGVIILRKVMTFLKSEGSVGAGASAVEAQFKALRESIEASQKETSQLRAEFAIMDRKIHVQQRTITKMEVLIIKLTALLEENGVSIPSTLQAEIDALTKDIRNPDVRTRASDKETENGG